MTNGKHMRPRSGTEVKELQDAERDGMPFLVFRDDSGAQVVRRLDSTMRLLTLGRHSSCAIALTWDDKVSRTHAVLERLGHAWTLADDRISRNGTYLNGVRLNHRQRLVHGDALRMGSTLLTFHHPQDASMGATSPDESGVVVDLTPMQRKVLLALCRPFKEGGPYTTPASNADISRELVISVDAVKTHMRGLFDRFEVGELPQNLKRARVVELAFGAGLVTERDL